MTISSTVRIAGPFTGNGVTTTFPFTYKVFSTADVQVIRLTISTGVETTLTLVTDYNITLNGNQDSNPGGNIVMVTPLLALYKLTATSDIANLQPTDLTNQGGFYPEVITDALDRATIQIQQISDIGDRTLKIPISDGALNMELPTAASRANSFLAFGATGLPTVVTAGSSGAPTTMTRQNFSGTGAQVAFTLASDPGALGNSAEVFIGGVYQNRTTYTISGLTLTFSAAPVLGTNNIEFVNFLTDAIGSTSADLVTYTPAGTGAVARSAQAKMRDTVSVKDFGAVGDGVADDTVAIQATITAVGIAGGCVYFPKGTYKITSQLIIYDSNIKLVGDGFKNTTIAASSASFNMMRTTNGKSFISISDLSFLGGATTNATAQYGIIGGTTATDETSNVLIENCRFSNSNNGMVLCSGKYWKVNNCYFDTLIGDISGTGYGILSAENSAYGLFTNNQFTGTVGNGRHAVYMSVGCSYSIASNNIVKDFNHSAFACWATSAQAGVVENIISGNVITGGGSVAIQEDAAIYLGGKASSCLVSNNTILNFANIGIVVVDLGYGMLFNSMIKGNLITTCSLQGIAVKGAATTSILSNYVNGCSTLSSGIYAGIYISSFNSGGASTLTNTFISNNVVFGTTHKASFEINASVPLPTNTFVVGNIFTDGATAGRPVILNEATPIVSNYISNSTTGLYNYGGNEISRFVSRSSALNFGSIAANTTLELTLAVSANVTTTNWSVVVTPETGMESGLVWCAYVSAANTVTIRVANVTVAAIDPASKTFIVDCYRHNS